MRFSPFSKQLLVRVAARDFRAAESAVALHMLVSASVDA
jgi:hypothetical protein